MTDLKLELATACPDLTAAREGSTWTDVDGQVCGRSYIDRRLRYLDWFGVGVLAFADQSPLVHVWPAEGITLDDVQVEFDRMLRSIVMQAQGWQALHAGAALTSDGAMLFCGPSGAGKSTTAYAFGQIGWRQVADDQVIWRVEDGRPHMIEVPFTPRLRSLAQVHLAGPAAPKSVQPACEMLRPIQAIYLLQQRDGRDRAPSVMRVPPSKAFAALLPHAHCFDVAAVEATRSFTGDYLTLAHDVPVFALTFSPDLERLPELLHAVVSSAEAAVARTPTPVNVRRR